MPRKCKKCKQAMPQGSLVCPKCIAEEEGPVHPKQCDECGARSPMHASHCTECGLEFWWRDGIYKHKIFRPRHLWLGFEYFWRAELAFWGVLIGVFGASMLIGWIISHIP